MFGIGQSAVWSKAEPRVSLFHVSLDYSNPFLALVSRPFGQRLNQVSIVSCLLYYHNLCLVLVSRPLGQRLNQVCFIFSCICTRSVGRLVKG